MATPRTVHYSRPNSGTIAGGRLLFGGDARGAGLAAAELTHGVPLAGAGQGAGAASGAVLRGVPLAAAAAAAAVAAIALAKAAALAGAATAAGAGSGAITGGSGGGSFAVPDIYFTSGVASDHGLRQYVPVEFAGMPLFIDGTLPTGVTFDATLGSEQLVYDGTAGAVTVSGLLLVVVPE